MKTFALSLMQVFFSPTHYDITVDILPEFGISGDNMLCADHFHTYALVKSLYFLLHLCIIATLQNFYNCASPYGTPSALDRCTTRKANINASSKNLLSYSPYIGELKLIN